MLTAPGPRRRSPPRGARSATTTPARPRACDSRMPRPLGTEPHRPRRPLSSFCGRFQACAPCLSPLSFSSCQLTEGTRATPDAPAALPHADAANSATASDMAAVQHALAGPGRRLSQQPALADDIAATAQPHVAPDPMCVSQCGALTELRRRHHGLWRRTTRWPTRPVGLRRARAHTDPQPTSAPTPAAVFGFRRPHDLWPTHGLR